MTIIACTKAVLEFAGFQATPAPEGEYEPKFVWYANVFKVGRKTCLFFMNELTCYQFVLHGVRQEHVRSFDRMFFENLERVMLADGFAPETVAAFLKETESNGLVITKTFNRSIVGKMTDQIGLVKYWIESYLPSSELNIVPFNQKLNQSIMLNIEGAMPIAAMRSALSQGSNPVAAVSTKKPAPRASQALDEFTQTRIRKLLDEYVNRKVPKHLRNQVKLVYDIKGSKVTLMEERPAYNGQGWVRLDVAQFRREQGGWTVYWRDSRDRWHRVEDFAPHEDFFQQLQAVDRDNRGLFWG